MFFFYLFFNLTWSHSQKIVPDNHSQIFYTLRSIKEYFECFGGKTLEDKSIRDKVLEIFEAEWAKLHKSEFQTTYTLKCHIMLHHVNDYVERIGGGLNYRGNDQVVEAAS